MECIAVILSSRIGKTWPRPWPWPRTLCRQVHQKITIMALCCQNCTYCYSLVWTSSAVAEMAAQCRKRTVITRLARSFKVTSFGTNGKPVCDFLLVNNGNLHPISHRFQVIAELWSDYLCRQGVPLFNALFLSNLWEHHHKSHIGENSSTLFVADTMVLT